MIFLDKQGEAFEVKKAGGEDIPRLVTMYDMFHPKGRYQGLPPLQTDACTTWARHLFTIGDNFMAYRNHRAIGHAVLLPDLTVRDGEFLVFVHQHHRGRGVGTRLTRSALENAQDLGLGAVWLTVDADNFIAIRLYRKFGFRFEGEVSWHAERKMMLHLGGEDNQC